MKTVGIRNLRNSLSKYINMAKSGERILITDHNKIVAEILPSSGSIKNKENLLNRYIEEQASKKMLIKSAKRIKLEKKKTKRVYNADKIKEIYQYIRSDR